MDQSHLTMPVPVAELFAVIFLVEKSVGPTSTPIASVCVCSRKNKLAQRTERGAHVTLWTRLQQALSRHQGTVEISWCKATSPRTISTSLRWHPRFWWAMLWLTHPLRKVQACSLKRTTGSKWIRSLGQYSSAFMLPAYLLHRLHHEAPLLTLRMFCSLHAEPENGNAPSWRTLHHTHRFLLAKGSIAMCAKTLHQRVVRWIGFETPLIHLCPCASGIRGYTSRIV